MDPGVDTSLVLLDEVPKDALGLGVVSSSMGLGSVRHGIEVPVIRVHTGDYLLHLERWSWAGGDDLRDQRVRVALEIVQVLGVVP